MNKGQTIDLDITDAEELYPRHFQMHFLEWKWLHFDNDFTEAYSQGSN